MGLDFHCNNIGCVENVDITSGDGAGRVGLDLQRGWPGPCLIKHVSITGFDVGIAASHREYSLVFSNIRLQEQRVAGITNNGNVLSLENVVSENSVPAVRNNGGGLVVLINSQLRGGAPENVAIESENASIYLRNIDVDGYSASLVETRRGKDNLATTLTRLQNIHVDEHFTEPLDHAFESIGSGSLKLPIKRTPEIPFPAVSKWVNVRDFEHLVKNGDWASAIQAAVDSGPELVYFPDGPKYSIGKDVILRGPVRTLLGGSPKASIENDADDPENSAAIVLDADLPMVQFHMLASDHIKQDSPTTLLLRHCNSDHISAGPNCGELFIEDTGGKFRFSKHQRVWARQLNPETKGVPEIINDGGQLWVLGLKTEYISTKIENLGGAQTEVLGGLMYPVHPLIDESLPMFVNRDSDISLIHGCSVYKKNHKIYMLDTQAGETREHRDWHWIFGRPITNLYRSVRP
ncbi:hypothetical protein FHS27_005041 [Rhodopirellula rubra]|uniref:Right handed beta helix domain-containing protein n=1 Tax=Aporhodopirellula rubra TaxID=980271 RepID=A0A7W5E426_9BACT|nr:hypothetical protein [Aporhodopirellula rubra]MBB3209203.1 hypothetical protein [Aporhodopirellula rubra]